jgi:hypothetical protein
MSFTVCVDGVWTVGDGQGEPLQPGQHEAGIIKGFKEQ